MAQTFGTVKRLVAGLHGVEVSFRQEDAWATSLFLPLEHPNYQAVLTVLLDSLTNNATVEVNTAPLHEVRSQAPGGPSEFLEPATEVVSYVIVLRD